jgi:hypothetical protein
MAPKNVTGRSAASPGSLAVSFACVAAGIFPFVAPTAGLYLASGGVIAPRAVVVLVSRMITFRAR